jgi:hypothetical protein
MERRRALRREPASDDPISRARLRTGRDVVVINVSNTGLLVEGPARLLPGTHVDIHVVTRDGRVLVRSRVTRAYVCTLTADTICYRGALAFERIVDTAALGYAMPEPLVASVSSAGTSYPPMSLETTSPLEDRLSA